MNVRWRRKPVGRLTIFPDERSASDSPLTTHVFGISEGKFGVSEGIFGISEGIFGVSEGLSGVNEGISGIRGLRGDPGLNRGCMRG